MIGSRRNCVPSSSRPCERDVRRRLQSCRRRSTPRNSARLPNWGFLACSSSCLSSSSCPSLCSAGMSSIHSRWWSLLHAPSRARSSSFRQLGMRRNRTLQMAPATAAQLLSLSPPRFYPRWRPQSPRPFQTMAWPLMRRTRPWREPVILAISLVSRTSRPDTTRRSSNSRRLKKRASMRAPVQQAAPASQWQLRRGAKKCRRGLWRVLR
mmetsp:Transcript_14227/g.39196  ORF Transcript_14227/g.39196 Transcript_14227/m.39196 type:complete len:209 (-) Transcript_14227:340-966(-)